MKQRETDIITRTYGDKVAEVDTLHVKLFDVAMRLVEMIDDCSVDSDELRSIWMNEAYDDMCKLEEKLASLESTVAADTRFSDRQKERFRNDVVEPTLIAVRRLRELDRYYMGVPVVRG